MSIDTCMKGMVWYALYTMPRAEKKVEIRLQTRGVKTYLPMVNTLRMWSDRKKKVQFPLLPGFVFVQLSPNDFDCLRHLQGAVGLVRYLGRPAQIRNEEIEVLRQLVSDPEILTDTPSLELTIGEPVEIVRGPLKGMNARYVRSQGRFRVVVVLESLGRMLEVNVPQSFLQKQVRHVA